MRDYICYVEADLRTDVMAGLAEPAVFVATVEDLSAELARRGISPGQRVSIAVEPENSDDWIAVARRFSRLKLNDSGWSDADIDQIVDEERRAVRHAAE